MHRLWQAKVGVWLLALVFLISLIWTILFGSMVLSAVDEVSGAGVVERVALAVAEIPRTLRKLLKGDRADMVAFQNEHVDEPAGWTFAPGAVRLPGYELLSRFDGDLNRPMVELVSLKDGAVRYTWMPDVDALLTGARRDTNIGLVSNWTTTRFRPYHPDLMPDGGLILKDTEAPLFRIDACGRKVWMNDQSLFHHSMEPDGQGGYWIPTTIEPPSIPQVPPTFHDEALARIDTDGNILEQISVAQMFLRHGKRYLVFPPGPFNPDQLHLNDIQPVPGDGPYWKKGDLFLSFRHISTIMLYRPSTDEIIWEQAGPWSGQHDVDILDSHRIVVFNNNAYNVGDYGRVFGTSQLEVYDFATGAVSTPWKEAFERESIKALFEGLFTILPGGEIVVEDHNSGCVLLLDKLGRRIAEYVNRAANGNVYALGWGRYIDQARGDAILSQLDRIAADGACATTQ